MIDVLVALLLLAVSLAGACATLIQTMRATHGALLTTRAVDLAADLTEELRGATSVTEAGMMVEAWRGRVRAILPVRGLAPQIFAELAPVPAQEGQTGGAPQRFELTLRWHDSPGTGLRDIHLPVIGWDPGSSAAL